MVTPAPLRHPRQGAGCRRLIDGRQIRRRRRTGRQRFAEISVAGSNLGFGWGRSRQN